MSANLYDLLRGRFPADRSRLCLEVPGRRPLSYGWLDEESGRIARLLRTLGAVRGERVVAQVAKSPEAVLLYLACLRTGAIYVPLNTAYTEGEMDYFIRDAGPSLVVRGPEAAGREAGDAAAGEAPQLTLDGKGGGSLVERSRDLAPDEAVEALADDDIAAIVYTSGTTGRSKGAMLSHGNLASNALALHRLWGWRPGDVLLHALPIFHVHGLFVAMHTALLNGSPMLFLPGFEAGAVLELMPRATVMMGVPTHYTRLLQRSELVPERCSNVRLFISGSAPLLAETFLAFERRTGRRILERYGMTEAGMITSNPLDGDRVAGSVGFPLPGVAVRVADQRGVPLPRGRIGILEVAGPNVFRGYWRQPEKTAAEFREGGWFITGDLARIDEDGRVFLAGRAKDLIISGGYNIYPPEVEGAIDALPGVLESAVVGAPHPDFGEAVVAFVVGEGGGAPDEASLIAALAGRIARFKQPKRVLFVASLPRNAMGKVQKNELRERVAGLFGTG